MERLKPPQMVRNGHPEDLRDYLFEMVGEINAIIEELDKGPLASRRAGDNAQQAVARGSLDMSGHRIMNLPTPQAARDAVTLEYMQQYVAGRMVK